MGLRVLRTASILLAITLLAPAAAAATDDPGVDAPKAPKCASVQKAPADEDEFSVGVAVPGESKDSVFVQVEATAPETENTNGTYVAVYAAPLWCL